MHFSVRNRLIKKSKQSSCVCKVSAVAFDRSGDVLGFAHNMPHLTERKGGHHAEMRLMKQYGRKIYNIFIARTGKSGEMKPIHPCKMCSAHASKLGISIKTLMG